MQGSKDVFTPAWKAIDSLERVGLYRSALERVTALNAQAKAAHNNIQVVKTAVYGAKYQVALGENGWKLAFAQMEAEQTAAPQPAKAVLQNMLADLYFTYMDNRRYALMEEEDTAPQDTGKWSGAQLERRTLELYAASIQETALLQTMPTGALGELMMAGKDDSLNGQPLRPTLYDVLAHRALLHLGDERSFLHEPAYRFVLDQPAAFAMPEVFAGFNFGVKDSLLGKWLAMRTFQTITAAHLQKNETAALLDATLIRLRFVYNNYTLPDREMRYEDALKQLRLRFKGHPGEAEIMLEQAKLRLGQMGENPDAVHAGFKKRAAAICDTCMNAYPNTYGGKLCRSFHAELSERYLRGQIEQANLPNRPILSAVTFRNVPKIWVQVRKNTNDVLADWELDNKILEEKERLRHIQQQPLVQSKSWEVPGWEDMLLHTTEIALTPLAPGRYYLVLSDNPDFDPQKGHLYAARFMCSQLATIELSEMGTPTRMLVMDRETGEPLAGVKTFFKVPLYDIGQKILGSDQPILTDSQGLVIALPPVGSAFVVRGNDTLFCDDIRQRWGSPEKARRLVHFFTDRGLYRPGQSVYFKALLLERDERNTRIVPNTPVDVHLKDVNGQKKATLSLRTDEFGSINGVFTLPSGGLTGKMTLSAEGFGYEDIQVEAYKRPKFEAKWKPIEGAYRIGDTVSVTVEVANYAGNPVDGAQVVWRATRSLYVWDDLAYGYANRTLAITHGVLLTDAAGRATVRFKVPKVEDEFYGAINDYGVELVADVTDISGETRSCAHSFRVGEEALQIFLTLGESAHWDNLAQVPVRFANRSGQPIRAKGALTLQRLKEPQRITYQRHWDMPDVFTLAEADFRRDFPGLAWKNEDKPSQWASEGGPAAYSFEHSGTGFVNIKGSAKPGWYKLRIEGRDSLGQTVHIERTVRVWDEATRLEGIPDIFSAETPVSPGDSAIFWAGARQTAIRLFLVPIRKGKALSPQWLTLNGVQRLGMSVGQSDEGGIEAICVMVRHNRCYSRSLTWPVPFSSKQLNIELETFRDRLEPGAPEEWRLNISGPQKEQVAARLAASLYDAALDQFLPFGWSFSPFLPYNSSVAVDDGQFKFSSWDGERFGRTPTVEAPVRQYPNLTWFNFLAYSYRDEYGEPIPIFARYDTVVTYDPETYDEPVQLVSNIQSAPSVRATVRYVPPVVSKDEVVVDELPLSAPTKPNAPPPIRRNLNETAFFFPDLHTDAEGNVVLKFTAPEALTRWKLLLFAHTKDLKYALAEKTTVTQKQLMVLPNPPRFLRQGDVVEFSAKVSNLSQANLAGRATLSLLDAATLQPIEAAFGLKTPTVSFDAAAGRSTALVWTIHVPDHETRALTWQIVAEANNTKDGETGTLPIVANKILVTETLPIALRGKQHKTFSFDAFKNSQPSQTLVPHTYTIELTGNPVWYAVQALPYLMEYPHECSEQVFSRLYANALATNVIQKLPRIRQVYERWKGTDALNGPLQKNSELKSALLEETPWVFEAQAEAQQRQNIALLFDLNRMADEQAHALGILASRQNDDGGWPWFPGGSSDRFITQHVLTGLGHLERLGALDWQTAPEWDKIRSRALGFCDKKAQASYEASKIIALNKPSPKDERLDPVEVQYLYMRSFYPNNDQGDKPTQAISYHLNQTVKHWLKAGLCEQAMIALCLHRLGNPQAARAIIASLRERATVKEELGMYWPMTDGYRWYEMPVETQALLIEAFHEVANDTTAVENLRIWLLKNKQTNSWASTKATTEAIYALLLGGTDWLSNAQPLSVELGGEPISPTESEPGTGYFKQQWRGTAIHPTWNTIKIENPNGQPIWGGLYWQYFESLDNIKGPAQGPLKISKSLFVETLGPNGVVLKPLAEGAPLKRGDKIRVRLELQSDRAMEYLHLKDLRAAGLEPTNVLSGYRWKSGLGYYESTQDLATHYFIDYLPKGTFVLEYGLVANLNGHFSNGIATLQCMYAPAFSGHSKGQAIDVRDEE